MISSAFWVGKRVFLTGHTGFKGSWLTLMLARLNAVTTGFALEPPSAPSLFDLAGVGEHLNDIRGDIRDLPRLRAAMNAAEPEIVIHMAAQPLARASYKDPIPTFATNVMGTVNVLEAARAVKSVAAVLVVENKDSGGVLGKLATAAFEDSLFAGGRSAKIFSARAGAVVGGGDFAADRLIPDAFRAFVAGRALCVRNPAAVRPWQHVLEPLTGCLMLVEAAMTRFSRIEAGWDFGPGAQSERSVEALVTRFVEEYGADARWCLDPRPHPHEADLLRLDATKAREILGWSALLDFAETVTWTAKWYRAVAEGEDAARITRAQVDAYLGQRVRIVSPFASQQYGQERHEQSRVCG